MSRRRYLVGFHGRGYMPLPETVMVAPQTEDPKAYFLSQLDTAWLRLHVETHLIFGPIARHVPMGWVMFAILLVFFVYSLLNPRFGSLPYMDAVLFGLGLLFIPFLMRTWPRYHQAAIGWIAFKGAIGLFAVLFITAIGPMGLMGGQPGGLLIFLLGFIWLPSLEFIPKITPHQKWLTVGRILLTFPVAYLGLRSGYWR